MTREEAIKILSERYSSALFSERTALGILIPELKESEDEKIRKEINILYADIDSCITELLKARTDKDLEAESKAIFKMEGLMVATLQDLSCIEDYLEKQKEKKPLEYLPKEKINDIIDKLTDLSYSKLIPFKSRESQKIDEISTDILGLLDYPIEKKQEQKPEWSEEDEKMLSRCIKSVECSKQFADSETYKAAKDVEMNWLKSLQPQVKQEQNTLEYLPKEKIYHIVSELINLSLSGIIPIESEGYTKIIEIKSNVLKLLDYPTEKKQEQIPVDLEKEMDKYYGMYRDKAGETYDIEDDEPCFDWKEDELSENKMRMARHFYELGLKARKDV